MDGCWRQRGGGGVREPRRGRDWSLLSTLDGQPGRSGWDARLQPPGHLGVPGLLPDPVDPNRLWAVVQGSGSSRRPTTVSRGRPGTTDFRRLAARAPRRRLLSPRTRDVARHHDRLYQQTTAASPERRPRRSWVEITDGLPTDFGFAAAAHPHDRDSSYVIPLDPGQARCMPEGRAAVGGRTTPAELAAPRPRAAAERRAPRRAARGPRRRPVGRAGALLRDEHRADVREQRRRRELVGARGLPAGDRVGRGGGGRLAIAVVHLPPTLPPLFDGLPRKLEIDAATVEDAIASLDHRWPGLLDRLCEPGPVLVRTSTSTSTSAGPSSTPRSRPSRAST